MTTKLFIDSDTALNFKSRAQAFIYAEKNGIPSMVLTQYPVDSGLKFSVFNPYIKSESCIEYFNTESEALKYIGSFL